mgnify:CR=1 FL=1
MSNLGERSIRFWYTNYRGERSIRTAVPVILSWGQSQWHPRPQWLMTAFDMDKGAERTFALEDCQFIPSEVSEQSETSDPQERLNVAAMEVAAYGVNIQRLRELEDAYHDFASSRMLRQGDT